MRQTDEILDYIRITFVSEDTILHNIRERLAAHDEHLIGIQLGAEEGKLVQLLAQLAGVKKVVEIGSLAGYSALWMARALPKEGVIHAINKDQQHDILLRETVRQYEANQEDSGKIVPHLGDARDVLTRLESQAPFDMVFIDADKGGYCEYLDWAERHIRKEGLIIGDNTLLFGHAIANEKPAEASQKAWKAMREFNRRLADPTKYQSILIPTLEGLTVARKIFS